ncbi:MAG: hypothetical protein U0556_11885 [Dehalococcoidia bacterium]
MTNAKASATIEIQMCSPTRVGMPSLPCQWAGLKTACSKFPADQLIGVIELWCDHSLDADQRRIGYHRQDDREDGAHHQRGVEEALNALQDELPQPALTDQQCGNGDQTTVVTVATRQRPR